MDNIIFNGVSYPCRTIRYPDFGSITVSVESLGFALMSDGEFVSDIAEKIDEEIYFYVPDDVINLPELELAKYVYREE